MRRILTRSLALCLKAAGEPIFWLAGRRHSVPLDDVRRILLLALDNPGDALLITPCLTALKERFPSAAITVLAGEWSRELLEVHPAVSRVIPYHTPWLAPVLTHLKAPPSHPVRDLFRCLGTLWWGNFDLTVETRGEACHILLSYFSGAPHRVGYAIRSEIPWLSAEDLSGLLTRCVPYPRDQRLRWHQVDYHLHVVSTLGAIPSDPSLVLPVPTRDRQVIERWLKQEGLGEDTLLIGVQPGASIERKRWSCLFFAQVLDALTKRWDARVVVIGSSQERGVARELAALMEHPPILATGKTTLLEAAALIQQCQLVICNDSAVTHICSAVKTPVVAITRHPSTPYAPYRTRGAALTRRLDCMNLDLPEGCRCPFPEYRCLQQVTPEEVLREAEALLQATPPMVAA